MEILFYFIIFIFGLAVGSFLNSIIYRLRTHETFFLAPLKSRRGFFSGFQRSYCPDCKKTLGWQDLIPILSFLSLKGKCRYCQEKISLQYPAVELTTGTLFVFIYQLTIINQQLTISNFLNLFYLFLISCFLIIIFVYDLRYYIIPDKIIYPAIGIAFLYRFFEIWKFGFVSDYEPVASLPVIASQLNGFQISDFKALLNPLCAAIFASALFLTIVLISHGKWMGWGDPKLAFFMGLFLGFPNIIIALFLSFLMGAIIGIGLIVFGKKGLKSEVPFGPFLVTGTFIALFWGHNLINRYLGLFW